MEVERMEQQIRDGQQEELWRRFARTGGVEAYLDYRKQWDASAGLSGGKQMP